MRDEIEYIDYDTALAQFGFAEYFAVILKTFVTQSPSLFVLLKNPNADNLPACLIDIHGLKGPLFGGFARNAGAKNK
jgi:hypothetical protein